MEKKKEKTNAAAVEYLKAHIAYSSTDYPGRIINLLVSGGFIESDVETAEKYVKAAKDWVNSHRDHSSTWVFDMASGWTSSAWEVVLGVEKDSLNRLEMQNIYAALKILEAETEAC